MNNESNTQKRVVVTGLGLVTPVGNTVDTAWESIVAGKSGFSTESQFFDVSKLDLGGVCEVKDFDPAELLGRREARRRDRYQHFASVASNEAIAQSQIKITDDNRDRIGVLIGTGAGGIQSTIKSEKTMQEKGPRRVSPFAAVMIMINGAAGMISIDHGIQGPSLTTATACAAGSDGIGQAYRYIKSGWIDAAITGGTECPMTEVTMAGFAKAGALSNRTDGTPSPFDKSRDGFIPGEGAGMLVIESLEHAQARGANILCELVGYGCTTDAFHITAPSPDGSGAARAIHQALQDGGLSVDDVDYINAHGTGTLLNDKSETAAIKAAYGEAAYNIGISSTKSMTGHIMGGTGALEAVFCALAIRDNVMPPTINFVDADPECDLDYVPNTARKADINVAMTHSFGFGGHNSVLAFKRFTG